MHDDRPAHQTPESTRCGIQEEINKLQIVRGEQEGKQGSAKEKTQRLEHRLADIRAVLLETSTELQVLQSVKTRHRSDKVVYDQRKFELEQELIHKRKQLSIYRREGLSEQEGQDRTGKVYEQLRAELIEEQREREEHICNLEAMIE
jgi:hypothetical protein